MLVHEDHYEAMYLSCLGLALPIFRRPNKWTLKHCKLPDL